jgi:hypothetical protein
MFNNIITTTRLFHSLTKMMFYKKENNIIVDPMACMIKLSLLSFYPEGTKISIDDNQVLFNEPSLLQGSLRYYYGYGREDLHNLYNPIQKSIDWYWKVGNKNITYLFDLAIGGLKKLKTAYSQHCTIHHTIDYYISLLQNKTKSKENEENNKIHNFLKDIWSEREVNVIVELLRELQEKKYQEKENQNNETGYLLDSIKIITTKKEETLHRFISEHSSIL